MQVIHDRYAEHGFQVVAISSDEEAASLVGQFVKEVDVSFPILLDSDRRVSTSYGATSLPISFILDADGQVVAAAQGARDCLVRLGVRGRRRRPGSGRRQPP